LFIYLIKKNKNTARNCKSATVTSQFFQQHIFN